MEAVNELDRAWAVPSPGPQLRKLRRAAEALRERFLVGPRVVAIRTFPLVALPFPARVAFAGAALSPAPIVTVTHRCVLVQLLDRGELRNLLFNPTAVEPAQALPVFPRTAERFFGRRFETLEQQLAHLGLVPADIDWVAFESLQLQELAGLATRFPNAKLLVAEDALRDLEDLHPLQRAWHVLDTRPTAVTLTTGDVSPGDGVLLLRTPGRAPGAQSLFLNTTSGIWGVSGNGACADSWSPHASKIAGLAATADRLGLEVLPGSTAPDALGLQYNAMVVERTLAERLDRAPGFLQLFPVSEVTPGLLAPGLGPTVVHEAISDGAVVRPRERA